MSNFFETYRNWAFGKNPNQLTEGVKYDKARNMAHEYSKTANDATASAHDDDARGPVMWDGHLHAARSHAEAADAHKTAAKNAPSAHLKTYHANMAKHHESVKAHHAKLF